MKAIAAFALLLTFVAVPVAQDRSRSGVSSTLERAFAAGGKVRLDLSSGDHRIVRGSDSRIRVVWQTRTAEQLRDAKVRLNVEGREAEVVAEGPDTRDGDDFRIDIELPRRTDLYVRMTAGDLSLSGIEGNKDVKLNAGDLDIEVEDPAQYGRVNASVTAGDLRADPFGYTTGGLFRSFDREGKGPFELRVRMWAGDLRLISRKEP